MAMCFMVFGCSCNGASGRILVDWKKYACGDSPRGAASAIAIICHIRSPLRPNVAAAASGMRAPNGPVTEGSGAFAMSERFQILINWLALLVLIALGIVWGAGPLPPS
jgi:hypothetical protein